MRIFVVFIFCLNYINSLGQHVFASAGKDLTANDIKISFTIGEPLVSRLTSSGISLSSGFQYATNLLLTDVTNTYMQQNNVYPNPTVRFISISNNCITDGMRYKLISITGSEVLSGILKPEENVIDCHDLSSGMYLLQIFKEDLKLFKIAKIEKID